MRTALFVGSFDPFTIGHADIVSRSLPLFDRLVIGIGYNERKQYAHTPAERVSEIARLYAGEPRVKVLAYSDLTVDLARREQADVIVKGIRTVRDYEYEREQADVNRQLTGIDTIFFFASPGLESVSSTVVRELSHFGKDVSRFIPAGIRKEQDKD